MPELPEVETTLRGIKPYVQNQVITQVIVRQPSLRWPVPDDLSEELINQMVKSITRRGKYLLLQCSHGCLLIHLGMSGRLQINPANTPPQKHDHVDIVFANQKQLRYTDPRRFGCVLWIEGDPLQHPLLAKLGPEPLCDAFDAEYLWQKISKKKVAIKTLIMNSQVVVGVGNIYANEALFYSGIHPAKPAGRLSQAATQKLVLEIKRVLVAAIKQGGTTLKDFYGVDGQQGYFALELAVYQREGLSCVRCESPLKLIKLGGRATVFCGVCQS